MKSLLQGTKLKLGGTKQSANGWFTVTSHSSSFCCLRSKLVLVFTMSQSIKVLDWNSYKRKIVLLI